MLILSIATAIQDALRSLMMSICNLVYPLVSFCFTIFYKLGSTRLLTDSAEEIFRRVGKEKERGNSC